MKLLFTQDALVNAGAERSHLDILSRFSKEMDVGFVYFYPKHDLKEAYERAGIRLFFLDIPESYHFPLAIYRLVRLIRTEKPDLLISSLWRADIITRIASLITRVPLVGTLVNDSYSPLAWKDKKGLKYKLVYGLDRLSSGIPIHWIANAQALVDSHVKTLGLKREKISVVYRGRSVIAPAHRGGSEEVPRDDDGCVIANEERVKQSHGLEDQEEDRFVPRDDDSSVIARTRYEDEAILSRNTPSNKETASPPRRIAVTRTFISYGRLLERKGFQDAIQAFSEVLKNYPDCSLTIFGEGPYRKELEKLIQGLGLQACVFLPGKISNPIDVLINGYCIPPTANCQLPASTSCLPARQALSTGTENCQLPTADCQLTTAHCPLQTVFSSPPGTKAFPVRS
jgi:glycosyltransferase involved in cell wall biosynthesis